jgi:hypothetical protein
MQAAVSEFHHVDDAMPSPKYIFLSEGEAVASLLILTKELIIIAEEKNFPTLSGRLRGARREAKRLQAAFKATGTASESA